MPSATAAKALPGNESYGRGVPSGDAGGHARQTGHDSTRERILAAADEVFLAKGFDKATVRDICALAGANVAAVNYHFRDKRSLYNHLLFDWADRIMARYPLDMGVEPGMTPEQRLGAYVHAELLRLLTPSDDDPVRGLRRTRLVMNELTTDPPNRDLLLALHRPTKEYLNGVVAELLGPGAPQEIVDQCGNCVTGQCLHYLLSKLGGLDHLAPLETEGDILALSQQITRFSLGGIKAAREALP